MRPAATSVALLCALAAPASGKDPMIAQAMEQLLRDDEGSALAERILKAIPDRAAVVAEAESVLADDAHGVGAKRRLLQFGVFQLGQGDLVDKAITSASLSARRAAAALLAGKPAHEEATRAIVLAWIAEDPPRDVALAVAACKKAPIAEAGPHLWRILKAPDTAPEIFADAMGALAANPSPALEEFVKKRLADAAEDEVRISACIDALESFPDLDADALLTPWLKRREPRIPRMKAVFRLRDRAVLRAILLDPDETDAIQQRNCLYRLAQELDDAALLELIRDPRVARHRYFAVRVDVATALACVEDADKADIPLLLDYVVDEDPADKSHIVRSEAWLTLWTLTGEMHGAEGPFRTAPPRGEPEFRGRRGGMRRGVSPQQSSALERLATDLDHMRKVREAYAAAR